MTKKRKTEIDCEKNNTVSLSAEPHTNPGEEACRRPVMKAYRKQAGTDRKPVATQQHSLHSPATMPAYCKLLVHKQINQNADVHLPACAYKGAWYAQCKGSRSDVWALECVNTREVEYDVRFRLKHLTRSKSL